MTISTVERALRAASEAAVAAERAMVEARAAQERAEQAGQELQARRDAARLEWSRKVVAAYPEESAAADAALTQAQRDFYRLATPEAYGTWCEAYARMYTLYQRMAQASSTAGVEYRVPNGLSIPPFSDAMDNAMSKRLTSITADLTDARHAELQALMDGIG